MWCRIGAPDRRFTNKQQKEPQSGRGKSGNLLHKKELDASDISEYNYLVLRYMKI